MEQYDDSDEHQHQLRIESANKQPTAVVRQYLSVDGSSDQYIGGDRDESSGS